MDIFRILLTQPLTNLLIFIFAILPGHDFGISIIILTAIIRFALWPVFGKQLHSQRKLQKLQPEIAKIKSQAGGDKQKESKMLMELYKEKEVSPFSSCLPLVIQFPFLIALFFVFSQGSADFAKNVSLLYTPVKNLAYIKELIADPALFKPALFGVISMAKPSIALAILAGITQFIQTKMITPKQKGKLDAQTKAVNSMTMLFPLITVVIAWGLPAALPLYWTVTTLIAIFQQWLVMHYEVDQMEKIPLHKKIINRLKRNKNEKKA
ncbi:MAG: YidC/Oxa1 family membrane protein insertase [bacterium]|nr:YidC/Oxa1 family membrane protein insertase [bacterium]